jgi:uncharacterized FlaG/YvyC family protein
MDIKGVARNLIPFGPKAKVDGASEADKAHAKLNADNEKEGNGQSSGGGEQKRRQLSPEEIQDAVKFLEGLKGVKDNGLSVRLENKDGISIVYIVDRDGKIVRRIPESELGMLTGNREKKSGNLLNKAL